MNYNEKIKELTEKFIQEMESLKSKNQLLKIEKEKDQARFDEQFKLADEKNNQVKYCHTTSSYLSKFLSKLCVWNFCLKFWLNGILDKTRFR